MPAIKSVSFDKNILQVIDRKTVYSFDSSQVPKGSTISSLETYLNTVWLPAHSSKDYQIQVHIFSVSPLSLTAYTADLGETIPSNWWAN